MKLFVNALSLGSLSGQHVLFGHLRQLAKWTAGKHEFLVLHQPAHADDVRAALPYENVSLLEAPGTTGHWLKRAAWESTRLPDLIRRYHCDRYFTPAGTILPRCPVPQVSLAQNPWCLVRELPKRNIERFKSFLQRRAYKAAVLSGQTMAYNSRHLQVLYEKSAGTVTRGESLIVYQGINDETHDAGARLRRMSERRPFHVLSVSAMAPWKGAELIVSSLGKLRKEGLPATLSLVGPWPDLQYEMRIRKQVSELGLQEVVEFCGKVSVEELHQHYASAQVYCLMSRCESFGIPAVEAQAFATPVIGTSTTAMMEIGGEGGIFCNPSDEKSVIESLRKLLTDSASWEKYSALAAMNASRFRWENCSRPLLQMFESP